MSEAHKAVSISIIEAQDGGLALQIATKAGEQLTVEASDAMLAAFVSQGAKVLQDRARKRSRH